ncbi:hypothetical protein CBOM_03406 [Ceraceosorus bombacis]|uniref:Sfi1 spindle body n=1 Tax=Ceraceosorus bombacis TaxID=401625 RepID=A0A0P1BNQ5_9BASI|nr:hypothetical protein CBOM_03406 [Ceraceosorus bombacis]
MMLRGAWSQWVAACVRHEDLINLGQSFADVKKEERTRRILSSWLSRTRINRGHRIAAEAFKAKRDRRKMEEAWVLWTEKHYDISLRPLEYEVAMKRQEGAANAVMRKWQARTRVLPALKLDRQRLLSHSWDKWSDNLPVAVARRQAIDRDRNQMLGKAFYHWIKASKAKRSMRAAARFGGPSVVRLRAAAQLRKVSPFVHRPSSSPGASPIPKDSTTECKPEPRNRLPPDAHQRSLWRN